MGVAKEGAFEACLEEVGAFEMRINEIGAFEMRPIEEGPFEMCILEVGAFETGLDEIGAFEMCLIKESATQVGCAQIEAPFVPTLMVAPIARSAADNLEHSRYVRCRHGAWCCRGCHSTCGNLWPP